MNQSFNWKYNEMQESNPAKESAGDGVVASSESYSSGSHIRNICFVLVDGSRIFLNYAYLVSGEYLPEETKIILTFTSHTATLTGIYLEKLFYDLMHGIPRQLIVLDQRYNIADDTSNPIINDIQVINKE